MTIFARKALFLGLGIAAQLATSAATLTFEKFSPGMGHFPIPAGYGGLTWRNFEVLNAQNTDFRGGYRAGIVSPNNVIFNAYGDPAAIECAHPFRFESAFITAAGTDGLQLTVKGFAAGMVLYNQTYVLSRDRSTFIEFNFDGVDRVEFSSTGFALNGTGIAIDNVTVEVPAAAPENEPVHLNLSRPPIDLGRIVVNSIGKSVLEDPFSFPTSVSHTNFYIIDQTRASGGGSVLPNVNVNWDTNTAFRVTFAAPAGKKFLIHTPPNSTAQFAANLWWETGNRGGLSASGPVSVTFENLQGQAPNFYESDADLSYSHGFFGISDLEATTLFSDLAFTAMTIRGDVSPQTTGDGVQAFAPHHECFLLVHDAGGGATLSLVPIDNHQVVTAGAQPLTIYVDADGVAVLNFDGVLQSSASVNGPFEDVAGNPPSGYKIPNGASAFYRVRN